MLKTVIFITGGFIIAVGAISCSGISVQNDYDPRVNYVAYRSFAVMELPEADPSNLLHRNPPALLRLEEAIESEMSKMGYENVDRDDADLLIAYHGGSEGSINAGRWRYSYGPRQWFGEIELPGEKYDEATLVIDIVDARSKQLIWRGWGKGVITSPKKTRDQIPLAVETILRKFPPKN